MDEFERNALKAAVNVRMRIIRSWIPQAVEVAQAEMPSIQLRPKDGFVACQYISRVLWNLRDPERVQTEPDQFLFDLLVEKLVDAAIYRVRERQRALEGIQ